MPDDELRRVLREVQRRGAIGPGGLDAAIDHSRQFVAALPEAAVAVADIGSGGGLPGVVIAAERPDLRVTLIERRATRADLLVYAVRTLGLADRVEVLAVDAEAVIRTGARFDAVTARSFGPPLVTLRIAAALTRPGGTVLVSEPPGSPAQDRWPSDEVHALGATDEGILGAVRRFSRV